MVKLNFICVEVSAFLTQDDDCKHEAQANDLKTAQILKPEPVQEGRPLGNVHRGTGYIHRLTEHDTVNQLVATGFQQEGCVR